MGSEHFGESEESTDDELFDTTERPVFGDIKRWNSRRINTRFGREEHVPKITGCCVMPNGTVVFCDNANSNIKMLDMNRTRIKSVIRVETGDPFDVDSFDERSVVVSIPKKKALQLVKIIPGLKILQQQINLSGECYGVAVRKKKIYVCIPDVGIEIVSRTGKILKQISCDQDDLRYVYVNADIYYSCNAGLVCCVTRAGHMKNKYASADLTKPGSLVADGMNNLLVCNNAAREIHKLKPAGTLDKIISYSDELADVGNFTSMCSNRRCETLILATAAEGKAELLLFEPNAEPNDEQVHCESHSQGSEQISDQSGLQRRDVSNSNFITYVVGAVAVGIGLFCALRFMILKK